MENSPIPFDWTKVMSAAAVGAPGENCHFVEDLSPAVDEDKASELRQLSDHELNNKIIRFENTCRAVAHGLPDSGSKLKKSLALCRQEKTRRLKQKLLKEKEIETEELDKATEESADVLVIAENGDSTDAPDQLSTSSFSSVSASSQPPKDKNEDRSGRAFECELKHYRGIKDKEMKQAYKVKSDKNISSRISSFLSPLSFPGGLNDKYRRANQNALGISKFPPLPLEKKTVTRFSEKCHAKSSPFVKGKKVETVDLSNEDEQSPSMMEVDKPLKWAVDYKLYYPSQDDPEVVELSQSDLLCLEPESPLSSPIINFYIRFLKQQPMDNCYFFNTYFYHKLEEAVSCKMGDRSRVYGKIRRWWKGVNIFQKAYIFLPIHSEQHWSLVIICIPAIEDESGPIVLHLDSLGFHPSSTIFQNVDSLLKEEWSCLNQECPCPDVPIPGRIWKHLNRRIDHKVITVPKQENFYDCGLFVLYYIKRFISEAPNRFRRQDLGMFGSDWFRPEKASGLRRKIRRTLENLFKDSMREPR